MYEDDLPKRRNAPDSVNCENCKYWRDFMINRMDGSGKDKRSGLGECMYLPPVMAYRQAAAHTKGTWAGNVISSVEPDFVQSRPLVRSVDYCSNHIPVEPQEVGE